MILFDDFSLGGYHYTERNSITMKEIFSETFEGENVVLEIEARGLKLFLQDPWKFVMNLVKNYAETAILHLIITAVYKFITSILRRK